VSRELADLALDAAKSKGAAYADVRIQRTRQEALFSREDKLQNTTSTDNNGVGVRVLVDGTWGFAATCRMDRDSVARAAAEAVAIARANRPSQTEPVVLVAAPKVIDTWQTPIRKDPFRIPLGEADLLLSMNAVAMKAGADFVNSFVFSVQEDKTFASSEGSYITQLLTRVWPAMFVTAVDKSSGLFQGRAALSTPAGAGWEHVEAFPFLEEAKLAAEQARAKLKAKPVTPGKRDLVLSPEHMWLTIHESVGHPTELDRALGYEANFAGPRSSPPTSGASCSTARS
jgi:TldD protein